ncbi:hypothetical protein ACTFIZ_008187 [Dictyostelium cf. discoideum]
MVGILFTIYEYISNENSETISNLFKILELNHNFMIIDGYSQDSEDEENDYHNDKGSNKKSIGYDRGMDKDRESLKIFKIFKTKNITYDGSDVCDFQKHINYSALFNPDNSE